MITVLGWNLTQWACVKSDYDCTHPVSVPPSLQGMHLLQEWHKTRGVHELIKSASAEGPGVPDAAYLWAAKAIAANTTAVIVPIKAALAPDKDPRQMELNFEGE